jgi:hypothetical protein
VQSDLVLAETGSLSLLTIANSLRYRDLFEMLREHPRGKIEQRVALQSRQKQSKLVSVAC